MFRAAQPADQPALAALFADSFGDPSAFAGEVIEKFAGPGNVFLAEEEGKPAALLCAAPVTLEGRPGVYYYGLCTARQARGNGLMTGRMDWARQQLRQRGAAFAVLVPAGPALFSFYAARGFEKAFGLRRLERPIRNNLWAQADFDSVTAKGWEALRRRWAPQSVMLNGAGYIMALTDLYSGGVTTVETDEGYGFYFQQGDTLRFVELFAEGDRAAEKLMEAARQKTGAGRAVITLGQGQNLFLGEGAPQDYGMIDFWGQPFDVRDAYMRLMLDGDQ